MNRTILTVAGVLSASSLLLVDSAIKGTVLLALAAVVALILRRDSAATRHLVWSLAIVAMLMVPLLSAMLPQWRVLPAWMSSSRPVVADISPPSISKSPGGVIESPERAAPVEVERPSATVFQPATVLPDSQPALATPEAVPAPAVRSWNWIHALPLVWVIGFSVLILRLSAARWMLWNSERRATVVCRRVAPQLAFESRSDSATAHDPIVMAMETICSQLGIGRPVTLLIHPDKTIPVVWGILRCRLMLPAAARQWSDEQLQSVLLHELAHIKRRDTIVQLLAQVACALHWFNPLVWFAAWRLDVERERSCDDLVLASGIRPSAYAGHLLDVVTGLSPARWTQSCGLAMARKSSLEGRLTAVLGKDLNRRDVSVALAGLALAIAVGIAVPIAMLRAADEKWNPPHGAHIGGYDFSALCVHDGKDASFVIVYHGDFDSTNRSSSNSKDRSWTDSCTITAKKPGIALTFHRTHTAPGKLSITTAPAEGRDLGKPAPPPRKFGQKEYNLTKGRVFLLSDSGDVRQLDIATPVVTDQASAKTLAALIAAIPPQEREDVAPMPNHTGKLAPETIAKLKWGEPVNGLRMALAYPPALGDALLGKKPHFELVVQNVSEKEIHFLASDEAPNPRRLLIREGERIVQGLSDPELSAADWKLQPGQCGVLRLYTKEDRDKAGTIPSSAIESDLSKIGRYHAIVQMEIAKAPPGAWTGKLVTGQSRGSADVAAAPAPMHKDARAYYEIWQRYARANGDIPGALVGELAAAVRQFIKYNPTWETVPKLNALLPRLDATRDWKPADAIALLDEVAGIQDSPIKAAPWRGMRHTIRQGEALPKKFADATWGEAQPNGLHAAWVLEPNATEHRIGAALKARLLVQNTGSVSVVLQVPTWHQGWVKARDAKGKEVEASGLEWTTLAQLVPVRLAPGEYIDINTPGIGFGPRAGMGPWAGPRVGSNVLAKAGDELTLTHGLVPLDGSEVGVSEDDPHVSGPGWWLAHVRSRLNRELPLPADAAERTRLLDRAVRELFATAPSTEETTAFIADKTPDALDALAKRLVAHVDVVSFSGKLPTAPAKFRVLAADANADKQPRVVLGPGEYPLSKGTADRGATTLKIVGRPVGDRRTNDAQLLFEATEFTGALPPDPHKLEIPDGWGTWAIVCRPNSGVFYLLSKGTVRKIDYSNSRKVTDTLANDLPAEFRGEVKRQLDIHEISAAQQAEIFEKPAAPAATPASKTGANAPAKDEAQPASEAPKTTEQEAFTAWGKEVGGLQAGLGFKAGEKRAYHTGETVTLVVRVRNVGKEAVKFSYHRQFSPNELLPTVTDGEGKPVSIEALVIDIRPKWRELTLPPGQESDLHELKLDLRPASERGKKSDLTLYGAGKFHLQHERMNGMFSPEQIKIDPNLDKLATGKLELEVKEPEKLPPEKEPFTAWGKEVGGLQAGYCITNANDIHIGGRVNAVVKLRNVSKETISSVSAWPLFMSPASVVDSLDKSVRTTNEPIPSFEIIPAKLTLKPGQTVDVGKANMNVVALNQDVKVPGGMVSMHTIHVEPGKYKVNCIGFVQEHSALGTGTVEFEVKAVEKPFTAWGKEVGGLQAGLGFKAGEKRVYTHGDAATLQGETATLVVRLRNVGKEEIKFQYLRQYFIENPPTVTDAKGKLKQLGKVSAFGEHIPQEVKLAPGKEIELYEWKPYLGSGNEEGMPKYPYIFGAGKFQVQYEKVFGNSSAGTIKLDPALENLATGKLELEVKAPEKAPVEKEPFTAWGKEVGGLQAGLGFKAGEKRVYHHGETVTLVVRVRNVGKETVKFEYVNQFFAENPPTITDGKGEPKRLGKVVAFGVHSPREVKLAAGKEIELYEWTPYLGTGTEEGKPKYPYIFGTGKFQIQYEKVLGNSSSGSIKLDPALSKLATGKLELEVMPVAPVQQEAPKPKQGVQLERAMLEGTWAGEKNGVKVELNFLWKSEHQQVGWKLQTPDAGIETQMSVVMEPDGSAAKFVFRKGLEFEATLGRMTLGERGSLRLELIPNPNPDATKYPAVKDLVLTRQPNAEKQKAAGGALLKPATEQKLKWGEPVNGLRMALAWPLTLGEPGLGDKPEFYLVVQNVSEKAVRLTSNDAARNPRMLNLYDATLVSRTVDDVPIPGDWLLQPREAAFLRLFHSEQKFEDGRTSSVLKENVVSTLGQYSYTAEMTIGKAPAGAWTGKLVTGATRGSADVLDAGKPIALRSAPPMSWGVPKDGLRGAWRIIGEMRTGGQAKAELWVWNASTDVVKFSWTERADIGLAVMMSDGTNPAREAPVTRDKKDFQLHYLVLPAGQTVKLKEFAVRLGSAPDSAPAGTVSLPLTPGDWTLQAKWSDTRHIIDAAPEWHGVLDTGEVKLKVTPEGATVAETAPVKAKWPPVRQKTEWSDEFLAHSKAVAEARGTPDAKPEDLIVWGAEENGLRTGLLMAPRVTLGGQLPTRMVLRNVTNDVRELGLSLSLNRLTASAQTPDGKLLQVHKTQLRGVDALYKVTLTPGEQVEFEGPPVQFGVEYDEETKKVKTPKYPICGVETGEGKVHVHFMVEAKTGEAVVEVTAANKGADAGKPAAKPPGANTRQEQPKQAAKLQPVTEQKLTWGEPVNGLRAALVMQPVPDEPDAEDKNDIFLVVQNVTKTEVWLHASDAAPNPRQLIWRDKGILETINESAAPIPADFPLQPREVAFFRTTQRPGTRNPGGRSEGSLIEESHRKSPIFSLEGSMEITKAPVGAWTGKLVSGRVEGGTAIPAVSPEENQRPASDADDTSKKEAKPVHPRLADDRYAKSGVPLAEQTWPMPPWGEEKDGLSAGLRVIGDARIGGEVKAELWVRNSGAKDVKFSQCLRADVGLHVVAKDKDGKEHSADITLFLGKPGFHHLLLPPEHIVKVKEFNVKFGAGKNDKLESGWVNLQLTPGDYKLRAVWSDTASRGAAEGEWTGKLTTGEVDLKIAAANAGADVGKPAAKPPGANIVTVPDDQYVKSGFPADELVGEGVMWNDVQNGLSLGYRITGEEWRLLGKDVKVELWVRNPGDKDVKFQLNMRPDIGLRMKLKGEKGAEHESNIVPTDVPPLGEHRLLPPGHALKVKEFTVSLLWPENDVSGIKAHYFAIAPGAYNFHCELELPGFSATGEGGKQLTPAEGEWTGKLTTRGLNVVVVAPDAPASKPRIEHADVNLEKDGTLHLNRKKVTLDELKALAAKDAKKRFTIRAYKDVPYAKVIEVVDALKAAGVTEFSFSEARVGDGKYRVANRTGTYEFDDKHGFSICRPSERPQWFTVSWPAEGDRPACALRTFPNVSDKTDGKWAVVWEPGTDVLWWVDNSEVGKMTLTDPVHVIVDREGRTNNFSRDFGLPEEVKTEFRRLGFVIGRDKTPGVGKVARNNTGGNSGEQTIVSAEFGWWCIEGTVTDADGKPLANVPVRVSTNQEVKTEKTDPKGNYRAYFSLPLQLLAHSRAVTVKPVLEGFTERDMAKSGKFNVLLRAGEEPQRVRLAGDKDFQPGPIPRFAERDLLPSQHGTSPGKPGRADFVMLKTAK